MSLVVFGGAGGLRTIGACLVGAGAGLGGAFVVLGGVFVGAGSCPPGLAMMGPESM